MDSDGTTTDDSTKKRRTESDTAAGFHKSKRTTRTPPKSQHIKKNKLDLLLDMMKEMKHEMKDIKDEIHQGRIDQEEFREEIKQMKLENENLRKENEQVKKENREIREELRNIKNNFEWWEKEKRKNNVVVSGLVMDANDPSILKGAIDNLIKEYLEIDIKAKNVKKIGEKICLLELESEEHKMKIMQNRSKLKKLGTRRIYIDNDLTRKEREMQSKMREMAREERGKGKTVKICYSGITIDGMQWKWNKDKTELEENIPKN